MVSKDKQQKITRIVEKLQKLTKKKVVFEGVLKEDGGYDEAEWDRLWKELVANSGASETVEGEMLRAIGKVYYRYYNDGDLFFKGYGIETAGSAFWYLTNVSPLKDHLRSILDLEKMDQSDDAYEAELVKAINAILTYVKSREGKYAKNSNDMLSYQKQAKDAPYNQEDEEDHGDEDFWDDDDDDEMFEEGSRDYSNWSRSELDRSLKDLAAGAAEAGEIDDSMAWDIADGWLSDKPGVEVAVKRHYPKVEDVIGFVANYIF